MKTLLASILGLTTMASVALAGEPTRLTLAQMDQVTAGQAPAASASLSLSATASGPISATVTGSGEITTAVISGQVSRASGNGGALAVAPGDGLAGTSMTNIAGTDSGSSGAWVGIQTSSGAAGEATPTSSSRTRAIGTPAANIAIGQGYASATGDATAADASTSLYGYGDIVIAHTSQNGPITKPDGSTARTVGVVVAVSPPGSGGQ
jgi:hypothetical protein